MGFIHMNGRVYDPSIGRFLSADPNIQSPYNTQSYDRYSYVLNNPLKYTDPSGFLFEWFGDLAGNLENAMVHNPILRAVGMVAAFAIGGPVAVAALAARLTYLAGGSEHDIITAGVTAGLASLASVYASEYVAGVSGDASQVVAGGLAGGAISLISGGNFQDGFIGGLVGTIAGGYMGQGSAGWAGRTAIAATAGGVIAELGGGKFANGALSAAFVHLFRESIRPAQRLKVRFFNSKNERENYLVKLGPEGNFNGSKQGVMDAIALYAKGPFSEDLAQDGYLDIVYTHGEPRAGNKIIYWDGLSRSPSFGHMEADTIFAHEFGHTVYGGGYNDHPFTDLGGGLGNVARTNVYRTWRRSSGASGYSHRGGYKFKGKCYAPSGYLGGSC
ncbi:hypothetical protein BGC33_06485 [Bathymodiolus thermophilus thioautotrophic gill symbiont]|uniref:RHS repeat-associated core domain-containing protein n=2 Tax=Bathymodiolus thermophilus thioautotrophic gill symbiont TaxID=2360 RepID=A0A1J5U9A7_9GAMM|nr:hypothetical protein BGC33_06485 [Bathymodiolus thermophilus thioautotrophic gill symbiont]